MSTTQTLTRRQHRSRGQSAEQYQRWGALLGGGALAVIGLSRRSLAGTALAAAGGALAYAGYKASTDGASGQPEITGSLLLNCAPQDAYRFYRDFTNIPLFSQRIEAVNVNGNRSHWVAIAPMGKRVQWDAEITNEQDGRFISWRSLPGSGLDMNGTVEFREAPAGRGTIMYWHMRYGIPSGVARKLASSFIGRQAAFFTRQDMRRMKALLETGEIPTTLGQPHGPRSAVAAAARVVDPTRPMRPESKTTEVLQASRRAS